MRRLFVGRLDKSTRTSDIQDLFETYGRLSRCEVKYGTDHAFAFVDFEEDRDAEDALKGENGRKLLGASMVVEWSRGKSMRGGMGGGGGPRGRSMGGPGMRDDCYSCGRRGHFSRDCPDSGYRGGFRRDNRPRRSRYSRSYSRSRSRSRSRTPRRSRSPRQSRSPPPRAGSHSPRNQQNSPPTGNGERASRSRS